jgi:NTP pyrophosphatase (non-canonical NTP hydrolase)
MKTYEELESLVIGWANERGIMDHSTAVAQLMKTVSEVGELADATAKRDIAGVTDGIGDVVVTLILYAQLQGLRLTECLAAAYDEIKDRKGRMVHGGVFVKDS